MRTLSGRLATLAAIAMLFSISAAVAAEGERRATPKASATVKEAEKTQAPLSQQDRMRMCNQQAAKKSLKGEERKAFMSACLKRH
jgi:hypothetical protein